MKKILSFLLAAIMIVAVMSPAAFAAEAEELPMVYVEGQGIGLVRPDGTKVYPLEADFAALVKDELMPMWKEVVQGVVTGDYSAYCDKLCDIMIPIFSDMKLGKDGEPTDGSGIRPGNKWRGEGNLNNIKGTITSTTERYPVYRWHYDWRLSPLELAAELDELIDAVLAETNATKVNLVSRCLGSNIAYAYLHTYGTDKVNSSIFYVPPIDGVGMVNALFTGEIELDAAAVERFVSYYQDEQNIVIKDEATTDLIMALIELLEQTKVLGVGIDIYQKIVDKIQVEALPRILRESFGTCLTYWSMVSADKYEQAKEFVFGKEPDAEWAEFIKKIDAYHEIQKDSREFIQSLESKIGVAVIGKYGLPAVPISADASEESDLYMSTKLMSFGATCCDLDKKFSNKYINKAKEAGTDKYISVDRKIDASTCALPDKTWFIKDLAHSDFPDCVNDLILAFIRSDGTMTVNSDPRFTQYLQYKAATQDTAESITPILTMDDTHDTTAKYAKGPLSALLRFMNKLLSFLRVFLANLSAKEK